MKHSVGEQQVEKILRENLVSYKYDVSIDDLKGVKGGILRFDFVVTKEEKIVVLEYNGIFHYHVVKGKTSMYTLSKQQMNDYIKLDFCRRKHIPVLWIPYWMNNTEIKTEIDFFLFKYKMLP